MNRWYISSCSAPPCSRWRRSWIDALELRRPDGLWIGHAFSNFVAQPLGLFPAPDAEIQEHVHVGEFKAHELLVEFGLAASKSEAVRLLRQGAVKVRMGDETVVLGPAHKIEMPVGGRIRVTGPPGQPILTSEQAVVSVGPRRHVRLRPGPG